MNRIAQLGIACVLAWAFTAQATPRSLCKADEQLLWSCETSTHKLAALCGSQELTATQGYVNYRYGTPETTDLQFPATTTNTQQQFRYGSYSRYMVTMIGVWFTNAGYTYELHYDYHGDENPAHNDKPVMSKTENIVITAPDEKENSIDCKKTWGSLTKLQAIVQEEKDRIP